MYYEAPRIGFQNWYKSDYQKNNEIVRVREKSRYTKIPPSQNVRSVIIEWEINCHEHSFRGIAYRTYKDLNWTKETDSFTPTVEKEPIPRGSGVERLANIVCKK